MLRAACTSLFLSAFSLAIAQPIGIKREVLVHGESSIAGYQVVSARVDIDSGFSVGRHSHHGEEIVYIQVGEIEMIMEGESTRKLKAGEGFIIPAGKLHDARNIGSVTAQVIVTYVVEKDKPLAVPAK